MNAYNKFALALVCCGLATPIAADEGIPAPHKRVLIEVRADDAGSWVNLNKAAQSSLQTRLRQDFASPQTPHSVDARWCTTQVCQVESADQAWHLDVLLRTPREGGIKRGISFSLGNGDPRAPEFNRTTVLPLSCRLRDERLRLVEASDNEIAITRESFTDDAISGEHLADAITAACRPTLIKHTMAGMKRRLEVSEPLPGVYLERRVIADAPAIPVAPSHAITEPDTAGAEVVAEAGDTATSVAPPAALQLERRKGGSRTQYVLHNQGHTLYLEFGPER